VFLVPIRPSLPAPVMPQDVHHELNHSLAILSDGPHWPWPIPVPREVPNDPGWGCHWLPPSLLCSLAEGSRMVPGSWGPVLPPSLPWSPLLSRALAP